MSEVNITFDLHPAQLEVFQDPARFRVLVAGRRFGKTHLAIAEASCAALDPANVKRQPVYLIAPTAPQAKELYWRPLIDKLNPIIEKTNINEGLILLNNGVVIGVKGSDNPDSLRGVGLWRAILDEIGTMKAPTWQEIIRPALADCQGRALFIGTPPWGRNHLYEMYQWGADEAFTEWKSWHFTTYDNPFIPRSEIEAMKGGMSTSVFRREVMAQFVTTGGGRIKEEWIKISGDAPTTGGVVVAIDLAGFAGVQVARSSRQKLLDEHVIAVAKVSTAKDGTDNWWVKDVQHGRWGIKECAARIVKVLKDEEPVVWGMERGALYNAVLPYIQDEALKNGFLLSTPEPLTHQNRVKVERILWALEGRFEHGRITFNEGSWNWNAIDQVVNFPSPMIHDDIPDALSYIAQLAQGRIFEDFEDTDETPYWEPLDSDVGF